MRETKDQKIERLEKVIDKQKKELSKVKKDRKRLNYAVDRLTSIFPRKSVFERFKEDSIFFLHALGRVFGFCHI